MSFHSHSNTPSVISSPVATSPKYSMSGIANEINRAKSQNGYLSTLFGRSMTGTADRTTNMYRATQPLPQEKKNTNNNKVAAAGASVKQIGISSVFGGATAVKKQVGTPAKLYKA